MQDTKGNHPCCLRSFASKNCEAGVPCASCTTVLTSNSDSNTLRCHAPGQVPAVESHAGTDHAVRSVKIVISGRQSKRNGTPTLPIPRFTYNCFPPTVNSRPDHLRVVEKDRPTSKTPAAAESNPAITPMLKRTVRHFSLAFPFVSDSCEASIAL